METHFSENLHYFYNTESFFQFNQMEFNCDRIDKLTAKQS